MINAMHALSLWAALMGAVAPQMLPDSAAHTLNELEHTYLDKAAPNGLQAVFATCDFYFESATGAVDPTQGRSAAAQWIRTGFRKSCFCIYVSSSASAMRH